MMQVTEHDGSIERQILTAMIVSTDTLARLAARWSPDPFAAKASNLIASWCVDYYKKHSAAPRSSIISLFQIWSESNVDLDTKRNIERYLSQLSRKYESLDAEIQPSHIIDLATTLFNSVRLDRLVADIQAKQQRGDTTTAIQTAEEFRKVMLATPKYIDVFRDVEAQRQAIERQQAVVVRYKGEIGDFFGSELAEDSLVAFLAPPKAGKSWMMLDVAWTAVQQKKKVAYFQIGDMTQDQIMGRFATRSARRPLRRGIVEWPISLIPNADGTVQCEHEARVFDLPMTTEETLAAFAKIAVKHKKQRLRLSYHPSKSININEIRAIVEEWDREGWRADCVVIDYSDNLAPNNYKMHELAQVEDTWTYMRQMSEVRKCLVVTATQVNKEGFDAWVMTKKNFSRNKMIMAIVSSFYGINQTDEERERGVFRLNCIVSRAAKFSEVRCCYVASALSAARAVVLSNFPK